MTARLPAEIKQREPFQSLEAEVYLNLLRTADALLRALEDVLKPAGFSHTPYNVLRILRGAGPNGLSCREVAERLLTRDPDITRLLDRLEARGLATRARETRDRRVITLRITVAGREILQGLDEPIAECQRRRLGHLGRRRLRRLVELLEAARATAG
jgi:DNA-binding MarR family transcriptional regulator